MTAQNVHILIYKRSKLQRDDHVDYRLTCKPLYHSARSQLHNNIGEMPIADICIPAHQRRLAVENGLEKKSHKTIELGVFSSPGGRTQAKNLSVRIIQAICVSPRSSARGY